MDEPVAEFEVKLHIVYVWKLKIPGNKFLTFK